MNEDALRSLLYDFQDRTAVLRYDADSTYDLAEIVKYVDDMSDGRAVRIDIFVGDGQTQSLRMKADGCWGGIAHDDKHVV